MDENILDKNIYYKILKLFGNKGVKFTTQDLAKELGISKRTIYQYFSNKEDIIDKTIEYVFGGIDKSDQDILDNKELSLRKKISLYFENLPDGYNISAIVRHSDDLEKYYPHLYDKVDQNLNRICDNLIALVKQGMEQGVVKKVNLDILKMLLNESLRRLLDHEFLSQNLVSFESGMKEVYHIILYGIMGEIEQEQS